jgi:hypothetical protein
VKKGTRVSFNKKLRELVKWKFGGRCGYCGSSPAKLCIDHMHPVINGRNFFLKTGIDVNDFSNLMPACIPCNLFKSAFNVEDFRQEIANQIARARKNSVNFRVAERFGLIEVTEKPVIFYFEKVEVSA